MPEVHYVTFNPDRYIGQLQQSLAGHVAGLRNTLRGLEDGSFTERADTPRQSAVIRMQLSPLGHLSTSDAAVTACNCCFLDLTRELIVYLDRMIAVKRCIRRMIPLSQALCSREDWRSFIEDLLDKGYRQVAADRTLTNPGKIAEFPNLGDLPRRVALSYFSIRRCLEHYAGVANEDLSLVTMRLTILADDREITALPCDLAAGTQLNHRIDEVARTFTRGIRLTLSEEEVEGVYFTIQHLIAPEVRRALAS